MAYVKRLMGSDEKLIGIARLHWIYVMRGLVWFFVLGGLGRAFDWAVSHAGMSMAESTGAVEIPLSMMQAGDKVAVFMLLGGVMIFTFFVIKVLTTEIALTSRRVMHKRGWLFVKTDQIDLEEIRGENIDLGHFGRFLKYGYLMLDCRFIGDIRLPAIDHAERFLRVLHDTRAKGQDALSVVVGKNNPQGLQLIDGATGQERNVQPPQPAPPQPVPEIQPGQQPMPEVNPPATPQPEIQPPPVPHSPPPAPAPEQPQQPTPQPVQPIPAPPPTEPPLQPPSGTVAAVIDPAALQEAVRQAVPQVAHQVAQELVRQGVIDPNQAANDQNSHNPVDTDLAESFDGAALDQDGHPRDKHDHRLEHALH